MPRGREVEPARSAPDSPIGRAVAELRGWLEAGERVVVLLAPRGAARRQVLAVLSAELEGRFVATPWSALAPRAAAPRASTVDELRGARAPRTLLVVEEGERLGAEGARVLRALAHDDSSERCAAVALAPEEAGAVLGGLGPGLEVVVLRPERASRGAPALRTVAAGVAALLAAASFGVALALLLPRFAPVPLEPAAAPPSVAAPPAEASAPAELASTQAKREIGPAPAERQLEPLPAQAERQLEAPPAKAKREPAPTRRVEPEARRPRPAPVPAAPGAESPSGPPNVAAALVPARPADGWLVVNAIPRAQITVDGAEIGQTPIVRHPISGGSHRVSARFEDGREDARTVEIAGRELYLLFDGRR